MGVVAPVRMRDKSREKEHGVIRSMTPMEDWSMRAQEAYASKDPMKRLDVVPDIGPGIAAKVPTRGFKAKNFFFDLPYITDIFFRRAICSGEYSRRSFRIISVCSPKSGGGL